MSRTTGRPRRGPAAIAPLLLSLPLALPLVAGDAHADTLVYHSEDGIGGDLTPNAPGLLGSSTNEPVYLYAVRGTQALSSPGMACNPGNIPPTYTTGDELCGIDVRIEVQGAGHITGFVPETGVSAYPTSFGANSTRIRLALARAAPAPTDADAVYLGTLEVDTTSTQRTDVVVTGVQAVNAANQLETIPGEVIASTQLPEPGGWLPLAMGLLVVAGLRRWRGREAGGVR